MTTVRVTTTAPARVSLTQAGHPVVRITTAPARRVTITPTGLPGATAYEIAVRNGFVGTEAQWLASLSGSAAQSVLHTQTTAAATWTIPHTLPRPPAVAVFVGGQLVITDVENVPGAVVVTFAQPTAGYAVLT